jgi:hypothetical protein
MYTASEIAEAMEKIPTDDEEAYGEAYGDLCDRVEKETGLSREEAMKLMEEGLLLWLEKQYQIGEGMLSGKVVPLAIHRPRLCVCLYGARRLECPAVPVGRPLVRFSAPSRPGRW